LTKNAPVLLVTLFLTGLQSTLFGPVKYAILPQVLRPEELTGGNGLVEMGTSISILLGMIAGLSLMMDPDYGPQAAAIAMILLAIAGNLVSRAIPKAPAAAPDLAISWVPLAESISVLRLARKQPAVRNAVLGISWFWFVGTVLTAQLPNYAKLHLGGSEQLNLMALALFSVGTGVGSLLCEKLSSRTVEIGLVPLGAFGMTVFCADLYFARPGLAPVLGLNLSGFLAGAGSGRIVADLTLIGLFAGFFLVPLFALVQTRTPKRELSRVIAALNIQNALFIVLAAGLSIAAQRWLGLSIPQVFLTLALLNAVVAAYIFWLVPEFFMRFLAWIYVTLMYRVKAVGVEDHVPDEGPALLVCNHVSYMDALIINGVVPRPIRFVMYYKIFNIPGTRWIFRAARAIPIAGSKEDPAAMEKAFAEVDAALAAGELVCIFPEGTLTKDGEIGPFKPGLERILAKRPVPVVPLALKGMWSSVWSRRDSGLDRLRLPRRLRAQVEVEAGAPLSGEAATAEALEAVVRRMRGDRA
jgi:1-acyl-sn-glycerol-3-phosphate acyltransferase